MKATKLVFILGAIALLAACSNIWEPPEAPAGKTGTVTLTVGQGTGGERAVFPSLSQFSKVILHFDTLDGGDVGDALVVNGAVTLSLPKGEWEVTAEAYLGEVLAAASEAHTLEYDGTGPILTSGDTHFVLEPKLTGPGTLKGAVGIPGGISLGAGSRMKVTELASGVVVYPETPITGPVSQEPELPAGRYFVDIVLVNGANNYTAVYQRTVVILSGLATELVFEPQAGDFLSPEARAALTSLANLGFTTTQPDVVIDSDDLLNGNVSIVAPGGTTAVVFTVNNPDGLTLTPDGATRTGGSDTAPVFTVDTGGLVPAGGNIPVTITVAAEALEGVSISVMVIVEPFRAKLEFGQTTQSGDVSIGVPGGDPGGAEITLSIDAVEKNRVYFTAYKEATQTIAPSGDDADKVTVHTGGSVDGETASDTVAVIEVNTRSLVFDGGELAFTLGVTDTAGPEPRDYHITLNVATEATGAAVFLVDWDSSPATPYQDLDLDADMADLVRIGPVEGGVPGAFTGLQEAIGYLNTNAAGNAGYLIRVEKDELSLPLISITGNAQDDVTIRLRGTEDGPWTLQHSNSGGLEGSGGFFTIGGTLKKIVFILENNITVKGVGAGNQKSTVYGSLLRTLLPSTLVMKKGSTVTGHVGDNGSSNSVIRIEGTYSSSSTGRLRIEGGSITNCSFDPSTDQGRDLVIGGCLIWFTGATPGYVTGALYKAASTEHNPIFFSGNTDNKAVLFTRTNYLFENYEGAVYDLDVPGEISKP
jgi:hypothetical protein